MTGNQTNQTIVFAFLSGWPRRASFYISVGDAVRCGAVGLVHFFESLLPSCGLSLVAARCEICKAFLQLRKIWGIHCFLSQMSNAIFSLKLYYSLSCCLF